MSNLILGELMFSADLDNGQLIGTNDISFLRDTVGQVYIVDVDGVRYETECGEIKGNYIFQYIGNESMMDAGEDTGEPFIIYYSKDWGGGGIQTSPKANSISIYTKAEADTEPDTATYRWEVQSEKTVIIPEGSYEAAWPYEWLDVWHHEEVQCTLTKDDFKKMYEDGVALTVEYNGQKYKCEPMYLSGDMGESYGYGNPYYMNIDPEELPWPENNGIPFSISNSWGPTLLYTAAERVDSFTAYIEGEQTLVSIGKNNNPITTLEGGIVNGVFSNARYKLATPFKLLHDKDWAVEWRSIGACDNAGGMAKIWDESGKQTDSKSRCILFRHTTKSITFTRYSDTHYHCGVQLDQYGYDYSAEHIYRLQNKVNDDGMNMVYLYVDGVEVAPMRHTFSNKGDEGLTDYVVGKDFSFGYMGVPRYILNGFIMDDIAVWESGAEEAFRETVDYIITYESEYGEAIESKVVTVNNGENYVLTADDLPTLFADGYTFNGWTLNGNIVSAGDAIESDIILVAVWEVNVPTTDYTITYQTAYGVAPASKVVTVNVGESYVLTAEDLPMLEAEGYIFNGWIISKIQ